MPGNEFTEEVHNFVKEDNTSQHHQSEIGNGSWLNFDSNLRAGFHSQSGIPLNVNSRNSTAQSIDSERANIRLSSQLSLGVNITQTNPIPDFGNSQPRNQQLDLKGFMHGSHIQTRPNQVEFIEDNSFSDRNNTAFRGLATFSAQQGNAPQRGSGLIRNSETPEVAQAPVNFDYSQQQLIRSRLLGTLQSHLRQQPGFNSMQLWQQQLMYKQIQELQRQQQLQQLDQGEKQQNPLSQLSAAAKPAATNQFPVLVNQMPVNDASNYAWSNNFVGGESKTPSNSQMFVAGNLNWTQPSGSPAVQNLTNGRMFPNDQGQAMQAMGFVPQKLDQSLYGMPVSSSRAQMNQYSQFQGMPSDSTDVMTKAGGIQAEKVSIHSGPPNSFQSSQGIPEQACLQDNISISTPNFQEKHLFGNASVQRVSSGAASGNFQQVNHLQRGVQLQNFQGTQEQADLSGNLQEKPAAKVGLSSDEASLDPTEQKLLFGTEDDDNWKFSFGRNVSSCTGGYLHGNSSDNDYFGAFPSIQSGSWSALMQEAVQVSSSEKGLQEEWSGSSFHKTEPSTGNHSTISNDNGKLQATWDVNNPQSAPYLSSRPLPLFNNADASTSHSTAPAFQHSFTSAYEQNDRVLAEASSHESFQQSTREMQDKQSLHNHNQKQFLEGVPYAQMRMNTGVGPGQTLGQLENNSCYATMESKSHGMQGVWTHQQNMPLLNAASQSSNKPISWNIPDSLGNDDTKYGQSNNANRIMNVERCYDGSMWKVGANQVTPMGGLEPMKSDIGSPQMQNDTSFMGSVAAGMNSSTLRLNQEMNQHLVNRHQIDRGKHVALDSFVNSASNVNAEGNQYNKSSGSQAWESTINNTGKELVETYDSKHEHSNIVSNEEYVSNNSNFRQHSSGGGAARESSLFTENDTTALVSGSQKSFRHSDQRTPGSHSLQYHQTGSVGINIQPSILQLQASYPQGLPQSVIRGSNHEQKYSGYSQFAGPVVSNNVIGMAKGNFANLQKNSKGAEDIQSGGAVLRYDSTGSNSFGGSAAQNSQNKGIGQTSQEMLELLNKVDQSRDGKAIAISAVPAAAPFDISASHPQVIQSSASQGFGLRLAPPSQWQPVSNQPSQTSLHDLSSRQLDYETGTKDQTWLASTTAVRPLPHEASQIENRDARCSISGQTCMETSPSYSPVNSSAAAASDLSQTGIQLQQQQQHHYHMSGASGNNTVEQSANFSLGSQANVNSFAKNVPLLRQLHESHDRAMADQSFQTSMPNLAGRIPSFRLASSADTHAPAVSSFYSAQTDHSRSMDAGFSRTRSSDQPVPEVEPGSGSQPSTSGMPQQIGFSKMSHNVWTNVPAQHLAGVQPHNLTSTIFHSRSLSNNNRSAGLWGLQKVDDQKHKGENAPSESGTCSVKSQQAADGEEYAVMDGSLQQVPCERVDVPTKTGAISQGQEPTRKHMLEGSPVSISSLVRLHQQDASKEKHGQDSAHNLQTVCVPPTNAASPSSDVGLYGRTSKLSEVQQQNYSLLHQMQTMKDADSDPTKRVGRRLKGADFGSDALQMDWKAGQGIVCGQNTVFGVPADNELGVASHNSFSSDVKMLSFASRDSEGRSASTCSQLPGSEVASQDIRIVGCHDLQNHIHSLTKCSTSDFIGGSERPQISPQMASSWFEQYGTYKNGQILAMYNGQRSVKPATQQYYFPKVSGSVDSGTVVAQRMDTSQVGGLGRSTLATTLAANESSPSYLPSNVMDHDMVPRLKKRKSATSELLPWHKEVTKGSRRLQTISMAELHWAQASNRLTEKVEDEAEMLEDGLLVHQPRRRLILTTQLMQQLFPAIPAAILKAEAPSAYESVTYCVAKSALGDACSLVACSGCGSCVQLDKEKMISEKHKTLEKVGDSIYSNVVEGFIGRSKKLEGEFLRLDRRTSMLDVQLECHELERFSIVNRLGKFHSRSHTEGFESSSTSENAPRRTFPQRYVTALSMPGNLPEGVLCLSL